MSSSNRFRVHPGMLAALCCIAGCAGPQAYLQGQALATSGHSDEALGMFRQAAKDSPDNAEYRMALVSLQGELVQQQLALAEMARRAQQWADAEAAFRRALGYEPSNPMALRGLRQLDADRRHAALVADALKRAADPNELDKAIETLTTVVGETPSDAAAADALAKLTDMKSLAVARGQTRLAESFRKPVSIDVRDVQLRAVFDLLAKASGLNFYFDRDVKQDVRVSISAKSTTVEDALKAVLLTNQLDQRIVNDNSVIIYPITPQKQKDYQSLSVRTFLLTNADTKSVGNTLKTILKLRDVVTDERLGMVIVRDTPEALKLAERLVALQDLNDPEVMLEVEVLEVKRSNIEDLGIQWPSQVTLAPLPALTSTGTSTSLTLSQLLHPRHLPVGVTGATAIVNAQQDNSDSNILANPRIRVRNKEKAKILIGDRVPVITTTSTSTGFVSDSVNYVDVGLKLEVEPQVYRDGEVSIKLGLEVGNIVKQVTTQSGTLAYQIGTRNASTVLRLHDGETQILAGLIDNEDRKNANRIPGLGSLPVVGKLFGADSDDHERTEIVLSITPHVLRALPSQDRVFTEFESGTDSNVGGRSEAFAPLTAAPTAANRPIESPAGRAPTAIAPVPAPSAPGSALPPAPVAPISAFTLSAPPAPVAAPAAVGVPARPDASDAPSSVPNGPPQVTWQGQSAVSVGDETRVDIRLENAPSTPTLSIAVGFDPKVMHVMRIAPGDLISARGDVAPANLSTRVDDAQGRIYLTIVADASKAGGFSGTGIVASLALKASGASNGSPLQFVSVSSGSGSGLGIGPDFIVKVIGQ